MNERRGAMCDNHKSFLFLFPWLDMQEYLNFSTGNNSGKSEEFNFQKLYYSKIIIIIKVILTRNLVNRMKDKNENPITKS